MKQWLACLFNHSFWLIFQYQRLLNLASFKSIRQTFKQHHKLRLEPSAVELPSLPNYIYDYCCSFRLVSWRALWSCSPHLSHTLLIISPLLRSGAPSDAFLWENPENISKGSDGKSKCLIRKKCRSKITKKPRKQIKFSISRKCIPNSFPVGQGRLSFKMASRACVLDVGLD